MTIYIDTPLWPAHGTLWSHLVSDSSYDELHAFAVELGIPRRSFDLDHYDVPASLQARAVELGARAVSPKEVVRLLRAAGLRVRTVDREAVRPVRRREYLRGEWTRLGGLLGIEGTERTEAWSVLGQDLLLRWNEAHRHYHDARHLEDVLLALDQLAIRGERIVSAALLAAWFHDAVYAGGPNDERDSARLAERELAALGFDPALANLVSELVLSTAPGCVREASLGAEGEVACGQLLDADLSIFAAPPSRYAEYAASVRVEYAHVAEADFRVGRAQILEGYLSRAAIYTGEVAGRLWEERARANLTREITQLRGA